MAPAQLVDHSPQHPQASPPIPTASNVIIIDNYDSFTWNIYQYLVLAGATVHVFRNDEITLDALIAKKPSHIVVSPGPGHPKTDSGISRDVIRHFAGLVPIFGVCMGMQCIFDVYGGEVASAGEWLHGKTSPLTHDGKGIYVGLNQKIDVTRYHSLAGIHLTLPECLEVSSWVDKLDGSADIIQGVRHKDFVVEGVQYHPESILTDGGLVMIKNFLRMQGGTWAENERLQKESSTQTDVAKPSSSSKPTKNNILQTIYADRKVAVDAQKQIPSLRMTDLQAAYNLNAAPPLVPFVSRLKQTPFGISLMAEIKRGSPSKGIFALDICAPKQALLYALAGASVISVLTEPKWFKGSIEDLRAVRNVLNAMPNRPAILRKEFIFDEYQILEARLAGADTVLLIVKMLDDELLTRLYKYSLSLGMEPLVEVQTADEMTRAVSLGAKVIGVNNRNLETFEVDTKTTSRLRSMVPLDIILAALSGISAHSDVQECQRDGINAILVGESIMRADDPFVFISELCSGVKPPAKDTSPKKLAVKICGTRSAEAARQAVESGADFVGMILVPGSKRSVSPETARAISKAVHEYAQAKAPQIKAAVQPASATDFFESSTALLNDSVPKVVGVTRNQPLSEVLRMQKEYNLDLVQLHGDEPLEWAHTIPCPVIRSFQPGKPGIGQRGYHHICLLDSGAGSGKLLDVSSVKEVLKADPGLRIFLAGGLDPTNVEEAVKALGEYASQVVGVDVSSGVEEGGQQSLKVIDEFVRVSKAAR